MIHTQTEIFTLPDIQFVGGSAETLKFNLETSSGTQPFNAEGSTVNFAVISHMNKNGTPVLSKTATLELDEVGIYSIVSVSLVASDTLNLDGKYIYQITIKDIDEKADIPNYGSIYIINNINKSFLAQ